MALSKVLLVVALLAAALATSAALPVSPAAAAPGLAALVRAPEACSYFECGTKTVQVVAKHTYPCWFEVAKGGRKAAGVCNTTPYECVDDASCTGWKQCKCDACETVTLTEQEYCKQPA